MSRKAGIIAPSPPPPCTLFELVRMVRMMIDRIARNKNPRESLIHKIEFELNTTICYYSSLNSDSSNTREREQLEILFFDIYEQIKDFKIESEDLREISSSYRELFKKVLSYVLLNSNYKNIIRRYKLEPCFKALININIAHNALRHEFYTTALDFYERFVREQTIFMSHKGYYHHEIYEQGRRTPNRGDNVRQKQNSYIGSGLANYIIKADEDMILSKSDIADIVKDVMEITKTDSQADIPSIRQIKEEWLKDVLSVYPNQKGRPSKDISLKKMKLKTKLIEELINKYQHSVA